MNGLPSLPSSFAIQHVMFFFQVLHQTSYHVTNGYDFYPLEISGCTEKAGNEMILSYPQEISGCTEKAGNEII